MCACVCLRSEQQRRQDDGLLHLQLRAQLKTVTIPNCALEAAEGFTGFRDPVGDFVIDLGVAGEGTAQFFTIHRVEGLRQVNEGRLQVGPHLLTLLLKLTGGKDHIGGTAMTTEAALAFRQKVLFQMIIQTVEEDASEDLPGDIQQGDATVIVADLAAPF
ncbi:hypothetical protein SprV_0702457800 [Sparganum proliferum]